MSKGSGVVWECQNCGAQFPKWTGQCPECSAWTTLVETFVNPREIKNQKSKIKNGNREQGRPQTLAEILKNQANSSQRFSTGIGELDRVLGGPPSPEASARRGGLVPGEVVLLAGEPGMGKSTLLSRVALAMAAGYQSSVFGSRSQVNQFSVSQLKTDKLKTGKPETENRQLKTDNRTVLYVCGEESPNQVGLRLQRLTNNQQLTINNQQLTLLSETNVDSVVAEIERQFSYQSSVIGSRLQVNRLSVGQPKTGKPKTDEPETENPARLRMDEVQAGGRQRKTDNRIVIVDSIQTLTTDDLTGVAGSVGQVRESAGRLMQVAKRLDIPIFLVGHVTKDGTVAGPKVLEHMVDAVLVLEGERSGNFRILRAVKNRFGAVDEVGLFAMDNGDMKEVSNPGELLLGGAAGKVPGSVLGCTLEGLRPLILEVQALAVPSKLAVPRRVGQGISERKLQVLCAVIERYVNRKLGDMDIFVSIAGGLTSSDPALDLPVVAAIISSTIQKTQNTRSSGIPENQTIGKSENSFRHSDSLMLRQSGHQSFPSVPILCGEVGLLGEVRQVQGWERREKEVKRLGAGQLVGANRIRNIQELQRLLR